jgi:hypothetical protein
MSPELEILPAPFASIMDETSIPLLMVISLKFVADEPLMVPLIAPANVTDPDAAVNAPLFVKLPSTSRLEVPEKFNVPPLLIVKLLLAEFTSTVTVKLLSIITSVLEPGTALPCQMLGSLQLPLAIVITGANDFIESPSAEYFV